MKLKIWHQNSGSEKGRFEIYDIEIDESLSLLETIDILNEQRVKQNKDPIAFDSDCREGICGACGLVIDGIAHGPLPATTTCQLHMHHIKDRATVTVEPFRARHFPIIKDLMVDKSALEEIAKAGAYISVKTNAPPDANAVSIPKKNADLAFDFAACIGCGACVASCVNAAAHLFAGSKIAHYLALPQGHPERAKRVSNIVNTLDKLKFGSCSNDGTCEATCPKEIKTSAIAALNREFARALFTK